MQKWYSKHFEVPFIFNVLYGASIYNIFIDIVFLICDASNENSF